MFVFVKPSRILEDFVHSVPWGCLSMLEHARALGMPWACVEHALGMPWVCFGDVFGMLLAWIEKYESNWLWFGSLNLMLWNYELWKLVNFGKLWILGKCWIFGIWMLANCWILQNVWHGLVEWFFILVLCDEELMTQQLNFICPLFKTNLWSQLKKEKF